MKHRHLLALTFVLACGASAQSKSVPDEIPDIIDTSGVGGSDPLGVAGSGSGGSAGDAGSGGTAGAGGSTQETVDGGVAGSGTGGTGDTVPPDGGTAGTSGTDAGPQDPPPPPPECEPDTSRCGGSDLVQDCVSGQWTDGETCPFACSGGECVGSCTNGERTCQGQNVVECAGNAFQVVDTCNFLCTGDTCTGECAPSDTVCSGTSTLRTCNTNGVWVDSSCPFLCTVDQCTGVCEPGDTQCTGQAGEYQTCDSTGNWLDGTCPSDANETPICSNGDPISCGAVCQAGFDDCDGDGSNGCEIDISISETKAGNTSTEIVNCGGCGILCPKAGQPMAGYQSISIPTLPATAWNAFDIDQDRAVWALENGASVQINAREFGGIDSSSNSFAFPPGTLILKHANGSKFIVQRGNKYAMFDADTKILTTITEGCTDAFICAQTTWVNDGTKMYFLVANSQVRTLSLNSGSTSTLLGTYDYADRLMLWDGQIMLEELGTADYQLVNPSTGQSSSWSKDGGCPAASMTDVMFGTGNTLLTNGCKYDVTTHDGDPFGARFDNLVTGDSTMVFAVDSTALSTIKRFSVASGSPTATYSVNPVRQLKVSGSYLYWVDSSHIWRMVK